MGVQYIVKSVRNPEMYAESDPNRYLKYAWRDICWEEIFEILRIDDWNPHLYYETNPHRSTEEIKQIRNALETFVDKTAFVFAEEERIKLDTLHEDAVKLLAFFNYYVANEASVDIC